MNVKPLRDRVIIRTVEEKKTTASGLIIPDSATEKPSGGEIIAIGSGRVSSNGTTIPLDVKVGDRVLFTKYSGTEIKVDGENLLVMHEDDIIAIIN